MGNNDLISRAAAKKIVSLMICAPSVKITAEHSIDDLPAVDAVPVVHARWIVVHGYCTPGGDPVWACSKCGKGLHVFGIEHGTYGSDIADGQWVACPNCGAKIDGEG